MVWWKSKPDFRTLNTQFCSGNTACSTDDAQTPSAHPKTVRSWSTSQSPAPTISLPWVFLPAVSLTPSPFSPAHRRPRDLQHKLLEKAPSWAKRAQPSLLGRWWHPTGAPACLNCRLEFWYAVNKPAWAALPQLRCFGWFMGHQMFLPEGCNVCAP